MQVHAVPEAERAYDSSGRRLPWAYEYFDPEMNQRRAEEKGPFGKATWRRGMSRSKTTTPARKEDLAQLENARVMDEVFGSFKARLKTQQPDVDRTEPPNAQSTASLPPSTIPTAVPASGEPTEVILYGFGFNTQYAAIEFFERVSGGQIYEDYDRHPPTSKYALAFSSARAASQRHLSQAALRKRNSYRGGEHWIKVTFDSAEAADRACESSPHIICGHVVHAERYRGLPPKEDAAAPATDDLRASLTASPTGASSATLANTHSPSSSATASSATATGVTVTPGSFTAPAVPQRRPSATGVATSDTTATATSSVSTARQSPPTATLRVRGAKRAVLRPAEEALLPVPPWWKTLLLAIPLIGWIMRMVLDEGGGPVKESGLINTNVPRKEDGSFDWDNVGLYWRLWAWFDRVWGTDYCGAGAVQDD